MCDYDVAAAAQTPHTRSPTTYIGDNYQARTRIKSHKYCFKYFFTHISFGLICHRRRQGGKQSFETRIYCIYRVHTPCHFKLCAARRVIITDQTLAPAPHTHTLIYYLMGRRHSGSGQSWWRDSSRRCCAHAVFVCKILFFFMSARTRRPEFWLLFPVIES